MQSRHAKRVGGPVGFSFILGHDIFVHHDEKQAQCRILFVC